ncbi:MAG: hypothetical protein KKB51_16490 [Candidatus Riflebacteria bacterium]|nr:hypothetical protein [Candidatus Riflebacteria bacterium]
MSMHESFTYLDWLVVVLYLCFTTWVGHRLRGEQGTIKDFFLGGKTLPWQAVTGSMIATEISALTFIGVPGTVFAVNGDFTYLQWGLGSIIARFMVGYWIVPLYYEKEIYSPYDYMGNKLGNKIKGLVTFLFSLGSVLGQSVRVLVTAIILSVVTPLSIEWCIVAIGLFAIAWTLMGGMRTVIWTDVVQFFLFVGGGAIALVWLIFGVDGGWGQIQETASHAKVVQVEWKGQKLERTVYIVKEGETSRSLIAIETNRDGDPTLVGEVFNGGEKTMVKIGEQTVEAKLFLKDKMKLLDLRILDPETGKFLIYTLWIALLAMPFQNFVAFGTDQLMAQRIFCCKSPGDARKAIIWSSVSQFITVLMLLVSVGLYTWYQQKPVTTEEFMLFAKDTNYVFPVWITKVLFPGLSGLLIAGAFAAAISSLDSILAALSQTTMSIFYGREKFEESGESQGMVWKSRLMVITWGLVLSGFAIVLNKIYQSGEKDLIGLAFRMVSYTYGPMLGILLLAIFPVRSSVKGIFVGTAVSMFLVAMILPDAFNILRLAGIDLSAYQIQTSVPFPIFFPINAAITFFFGWIFGKDKPALS